MRRRGWVLLAASAALLASAGARGGVDADLIFQRIAESRVTETGGVTLALEGGGRIALSNGAMVLVA